MSDDGKQARNGALMFPMKLPRRIAVYWSNIYRISQKNKISTFVHLNQFEQFVSSTIEIKIEKN